MNVMLKIIIIILCLVVIGISIYGLYLINDILKK